MPYQQASIPIGADRAEQFSDALMAAGALSAAIEDAYAGTDEEQAIFGEPGEESGQIWQRSLVIALFDDQCNVAAADGVDIDEQAIVASRSNAEQNEAEARFFLPDDLPEAEYDVVVANILANPLRLLGGMLASRTKAGGRIVLSGILEEQAKELNGIYSEWFDMQPPVAEGGWVRLVGVRKVG